MDNIFAPGSERRELPFPVNEDWACVVTVREYLPASATISAQKLWHPGEELTVQVVSKMALQGDEFVTGQLCVAHRGPGGLWYTFMRATTETPTVDVVAPSLRFQGYNSLIRTSLENWVYDNYGDVSFSSHSAYNTDEWDYLYDFHVIRVAKLLTAESYLDTQSVDTDIPVFLRRSLTIAPYKEIYTSCDSEDVMHAAYRGAAIPIQISVEGGIDIYGIAIVDAGDIEHSLKCDCPKPVTCSATATVSFLGGAGITFNYVGISNNRCSWRGSYSATGWTLQATWSNWILESDTGVTATGPDRDSSPNGSYSNLSGSLTAVVSGAVNTMG